MLDKLFTNGKIYTMVKENEFFSAIGIEDGKIKFLGSDEEAETLTAKETINLEGKTMIPGMADAHLHLYAACQNLTFVDLSKVKSIGEMISTMRDSACKLKPGEWIKGVNFDQSKWTENRFPTLQEMDRISKDNPAIIKRCCLHAVVANSKALEIAGIDEDYKVNGGGIVEKDESGMPNGILREQSTKIFDDILPDPLKEPDTQKRIISEVMEDMSKKGITTIHTYAAKIWQYNEDINIYRDFEKQDKLPVRVTVCIDDLFEKEEITKADLNNPYRLTQLGAYKLFSDGSMGSRSAALKKPYSDDPENSGFVICTQDELNDKVYTGYSCGLQPAIHAIGDRALDMTITAIEHTLAKARKNGMSEDEINGRLLFRIIHVQMIDEDLLKRMCKLPLVLDIQPVFLLTDLHWIEDRIGKERLKGSFALNTMVKAGLIMTGGSDCPVESYDPILGIYAAVNRKDLDGFPPDGFLSSESLSVYDAVSMFTKNVHYATGQESVLGTLELDKFADLCVLDKNIFEIPSMEIKDVKVLKTYLAGKQVF